LLSTTSNDRDAFHHAFHCRANERDQLSEPGNEAWRRFAVHFSISRGTTIQLPGSRVTFDTRLCLCLHDLQYLRFLDDATATRCAVAFLVVTEGATFTGRASTAGAGARFAGTLGDRATTFFTATGTTRLIARSTGCCIGCGAGACPVGIDAGAGIAAGAGLPITAGSCNV